MFNADGNTNLTATEAVFIAVEDTIKGSISAEKPGYDFIFLIDRSNKIDIL